MTDFETRWTPFGTEAEMTKELTDKLSPQAWSYIDEGDGFWTVRDPWAARFLISDTDFVYGRSYDLTPE